MSAEDLLVGVDVLLEPDTRTHRWRCQCGGQGWSGHHETEAAARRAAAWHGHNQHDGPHPDAIPARPYCAACAKPIHADETSPTGYVHAGTLRVACSTGGGQAHPAT